LPNHSASPNVAGEKPVIEAKGLRKEFGRTVAVEDLTLSVFRGEVFGFLGPNGAGKTTAVKMLVGLVFPTAGSARILGRPPSDPAARAHIGFLPEQFRFHEWLRADEFLDFHGQLGGVPAKLRRRRVQETLELVGLASRAQDRLRTFSKGMLQRIGIAQALMNDPEIVFLDEPTSALDPLGRREVREVIRTLRSQGKTVFLNSHLLSEVEMVCDRVAIIDKGKVVRAGEMSDLLSSQHEVEVKVGEVTPALLKALRGRFQVLSVSDSVIRLSVGSEEAAPQVAATVVQAGGQLYRLTPLRTSLEDLFVQVVEGGEGERRDL